MARGWASCGYELLRVEATFCRIAGLDLVTFQVEVLLLARERVTADRAGVVAPIASLAQLLDHNKCDVEAKSQSKRAVWMEKRRTHSSHSS
eukprot:COSAG01_NODE_35545_length_530_cov_1.171694_1_plen_90_part_01